MSELALISQQGLAVKSINTMPYAAYVDGPVASLEDLFPHMMNRENLTLFVAFQKVGWFRACVELRAGTVSSIPFTIYREGEEDPIYDSDEDGDEYPDELEWAQDLQPYLGLIEASVVMDGKAAFLRLMDHGIPTGIQYWEINSWRPEIKPGGIERYFRNVRTDAGGYIEKPFPAEFVVPFFQRDPFVGIGPGSSLGMAALQNADVLRSLDVYVKNALDSGLLKATLVGVPRNTQKEDKEYIESSWLSWFRGKSNAGKIKVVESGAFETTVVGEGIKDLENIPLTQDQRESLSTTLGVPHALVMSNVTGAKATTESDDVKFYVYHIVPSCRRHARALNRYLFKPNGYSFFFEYDRLDVLQHYELSKAERLQKLVGSDPILEVNEARERLGLKPRKIEKPAPIIQVVKPDIEPQSGGDSDAGPKLTDNQQDEIKKWRRKVASSGAETAFKCHYLPKEYREVIRSRLETGEPVEIAFEPPFEDF